MNMVDYKSFSELLPDYLKTVVYLKLDSLKSNFIGSSY